MLRPRHSLLYPTPGLPIPENSSSRYRCFLLRSRGSWWNPAWPGRRRRRNGIRAPHRKCCSGSSTNMSPLCCPPLLKEGDGGLSKKQLPKPSKQEYIYSTESDASLDKQQKYGEQVCTRSVIGNKSTSQRLPIFTNPIRSETANHTTLSSIK